MEGIDLETLMSDIPGQSPEDKTPLWMLRALCRTMDPDIFYPHDGVGVDKARKICGECAVQSECLEYALEREDIHGVWGGTSERERRRILRARRIESSL